ncbi:MAG TPA: helix-turn-helix transcriptional regulator [Dongiaceae bacterium]|nr:helix-turn-helix transcriptional regulator [Dongiaceae bacterium]
MKKVSQRKSSGRMASKGFPNPIDVHVGTRLRQRRTLLGMSQQKLAKAVGLTFQQVQKYERGTNRVGSSRLFDLGQVLDVPVNYFFEDMPLSVREKTPSRLVGLASPPAPEPREDDPLTKRETLEIMRAYYKIKELGVRRKVGDLIKALAKI